MAAPVGEEGFQNLGGGTAPAFHSLIASYCSSASGWVLLLLKTIELLETLHLSCNFLRIGWLKGNLNLRFMCSSRIQTAPVIEARLDASI
jgi:hypothetical protein